MKSEVGVYMIPENVCAFLYLVGAEETDSYLFGCPSLSDDLIIIYLPYLGHLTGYD